MYLLKGVEKEQDEVMTRLLPEPPACLKAEDVLSLARDNCIRNVTCFRDARFAYSRVQYQFQFPPIVQYGDGFFDMCNYQSHDGDAPEVHAGPPMYRCRSAAIMPADSPPIWPTFLTIEHMARISAFTQHGYDVRPTPIHVCTPETSALDAMQLPLQIVRPASPIPPEIHCNDWRSASTLTAATHHRQSGLDCQAYRAASNAAAAASAAALKDGDCSSTPDIGCEGWVQQAAGFISDQAQGAKAHIDKAHLLHLMHKNTEPAVLAATIGVVPTQTQELEPHQRMAQVVPSLLYGYGYNSSRSTAGAQASSAPLCELSPQNMDNTHQPAACSGGITDDGVGAGTLTGAPSPDANPQHQSIRLAGAIAACDFGRISGDPCNSPFAGINAVITTPSSTLSAAVSSNSPHSAEYCDSEGPRYGGRSSTSRRTSTASGGAGFSRPGISTTPSTASAPLRPTARPLTRVSISPLVIPGGSPASSPRATPSSGSRLSSSGSVGLGTPTTTPAVSARDVRKASSCAVHGSSGVVAVAAHAQRGGAADRFTRPDHAGLLPTPLEPSPPPAGSPPSPICQLQHGFSMNIQQQQIQPQQPDALELRTSIPCRRNSSTMPVALIELGNRRVLQHPGERGKQQPSPSLQQLQPQQPSQQQQQRSLGFVDEMPPRLASSRRSYAGGGSTATSAVVRPGSSSKGESPHAYMNIAITENNLQDRTISPYADVEHPMGICLEAYETAQALGSPCGRLGSELEPFISDGASVVPPGSSGAAAYLSPQLPTKSSSPASAMPTPLPVAAAPLSTTLPVGTVAADRRQRLLATPARAAWGPAAMRNESLNHPDSEIGVGTTTAITTQGSLGELRPVAATVRIPTQRGPQQHAFASVPSSAARIPVQCRSGAEARASESDSIWPSRMPTPYAAVLSSPSLTAAAKYLASVGESNSARPMESQCVEPSSFCSATTFGGGGGGGGGGSTVVADSGLVHQSRLGLNHSTGMKTDLPATSSLICKLRIRGGGLTGAHNDSRAEREAGISPGGQGREEDDSVVGRLFRELQEVRRRAERKVYKMP